MIFTKKVLMPNCFAMKINGVLKIVLYLFLNAFLLSSCSNQDDTVLSTEDLYANTLVNADPKKLEGLWSIYEGSLYGQNVTIPENNPTCGRDFFSYSANGDYLEYLITDNYECIPEINLLEWTLKRGILTYSDKAGNSQELVVVELTDTKFVFKADVDYDEDGTSDIFTFTARPYVPPKDIDVYSVTFNRDVVIPHYDKIRLSWRPYQGFNVFERYEIYRTKDGCNKTNAELITTIAEQNTNFYIDENPTSDAQLCYFFRLYTDKGVLSDSDLISVDPGNLDVPLVNLDQPTVVGESINLNWSKYEGYYFSHYEITVKNYENGSGSGYQEALVKKVTDINTLNYLDETPPYLINPVYTVHVVDIFGNRSNGAIQGTNSWTVDFKRPEVLELDFVRQVVQDPEDASVYLYGRSSNGGMENFYKYNYATRSVSAISDQSPNTSSEGAMKLIISNFGKELILPVGNELHVYNAIDLTYKYRIDVPTGGISDVEYLGNGIWAMVDGDNLYTFNRTGNNLTEISREEHFPDHQIYNIYHLIPLPNNKVVVGHSFEPSNLTFIIDSAGNITNRTEITSVIRSVKESDTRYVPSNNTIIGLREYNVYSATDFSLIQTFGAGFYPTGISNNGTLILGTPNDPLWTLDDDSRHEKKISWYNLANASLTESTSKGYSHLIFQNYLGQYISISSGFKRATLSDYTPRADIFVEIIIP